MALTINIPNTLRAAVESASQGKNTVLFTALGQPCYCVVIPKFTLQSIDAGLGTGTHPAFIVGGAEKSALYIGQYCGFSRNGEMLSLPGVDPLNTIAHDAAIALARANGPGWHVTTNVEYAALALWCWKNGVLPRGNSNYGASSDAPAEYGVRSDGLAPGVASGNARTLTGSGPASWRHDRTPFGISDLAGNLWEWAPGMRVNGGEINILENNDAAAAAADLGVASAAWRAIDGASGALVAPGTAGAVKYAVSGTTNYTLVRASGSSFEGMTNPGAAPVGTAALALLRAHGLAPIAATGLGGDGFYFDVTSERVSRRGGGWGNAAIAGAFALDVISARTSASAVIGARPAFVI